MRNLYAFAIVLLTGLLFLSSCKEENLVNPDIDDFNVVNPSGSGDDGEAGQLTAQFIALNMMGEPFDSIDMGEPFMLIDQSSGRPDGFQWTVDGAVLSDTTNGVNLSLYCPVKGGYDVTLDISRSDDEATSTMTMENFVKVRWIPVTGSFFTDKIEKDGVINIKHGDFITFTDNSKGLPDIWSWYLAGSENQFSTTQQTSVQYKEPGEYLVVFTATRTEDNETSTLLKSKYVNVAERIVQLVRATATDEVVTLEYNEPMHDDMSRVKDDLYITYVTAAGDLIVPNIKSVVLVNEYEIEITLDFASFSDDKVYVYMDAGNLVDATGLVEASEIDAELCLYGHNIFIRGDFNDMEYWNNTKDNDKWELNYFEPSPLQGLSCLEMAKETTANGFVYTEGIPFDENTTYIFSMEMRAEPGTSGDYEYTRFSNAADNGRNDALGSGGGHINASKIPSTEWTTFTRTIGEYEGDDTELYYNFLYYGGEGTIYIDNIRLYIDNPRN